MAFSLSPNITQPADISNTFSTRTPDHTTQSLMNNRSLNSSTQSPLSPTKTTQEVVTDDISQTKSPFVTKTPMLNTGPSGTSPFNGSNPNVSIQMNTVQATIYSTLLVTRTPVDTNQSTVHNQSPNHSNQSSSIPVNTTQGGATIEISTTRLPSTTQQVLLNTMPSSESQSNNSNQSIPVQVSTILTTDHSTLSVTRVSANTSQPAGNNQSVSNSIQSSPLPTNITQGVPTVDISSTKLASVT